MTLFISVSFHLVSCLQSRFSCQQLTLLIISVTFQLRVDSLMFEIHFWADLSLEFISLRAVTVPLSHHVMLDQVFVP